MQAEDVHAPFLFVGDLNGHHQEWFGSMTANHQCVQPLTLQLCLVAINWLSACPMHVVVHLTS